MSNNKTLKIPNRIATAPYNFVPLPEVVVTTVDKAGGLPDHDRYDPQRHSGYFEVVLTVRSPIYVRSSFTIDEFLRQERQEDEKALFREKVKNKPDFFYTCDPNQPVIPGSSLRGMLRTILEIVSYSKVQWVSDSLKIFYRAVAAAKDNPLGGPYRQVLGKFGTNVRAGYLIKKGDDWYVKPAKRPAGMDNGWPEKGSYLKIKENRILDGAVPGFVRFNDADYKPQYHPVSFDVEIQKGKGGRFVTITRIGSVDAGYKYRGVLVCSGNMLETGGEVNQSPRKNHAIVLEADKNAKLLKFNAQAVEDHIDSLTPFQKQPPFDPITGFLQDGRPIFYVESDDEIFFFGHCPNFRIPAFQKTEKRAVVPLDFVTPELRFPEQVDYTEAIFGFVRTHKELNDMKNRGLPLPKQGDKGRAYASRVFISDAVLVENQKDIWLRPDPIVPKILATPKPTAFQHYLTQQEQEPDNKSRLDHYGSPPPHDTVIRGHKLYWHQQANWLSLDDVKRIIEEDKEKLKEILQQESQRVPDTQHTQFKPIKPGVQLKFCVYFENLSDEELGALCWVLHPLGETSKDYCHKLGMGKPLGMGAVKLDAKLYLIDRKKRYGSLFDGDNWESGIISRQGEKLSDPTTLRGRTKDFEKHILEMLGRDQKYKHLYELDRIGMLLKILEWPGLDPQKVQYMELEQFESRPVLPNPLRMD